MSNIVNKQQLLYVCTSEVVRFLVQAIVAIFGMLLMASDLVSAQSAKREVAFVANSEDGTVSLIDIMKRSVIGDLDINPLQTRSSRPGTPNYAQDTDISPDGRTLYVSRGYLGDVAAFDIASRKLLWNRSINTLRADHMAVSHDGRSIFVSALVDNRVYRIDAKTGEITGQILTGVWPHDVKLTKDGRQVYNSSLGEIPSAGFQSGSHPEDPPTNLYQLTIADASSLQILDRIKLDAPFRPWAFAADGRSIFAQLSNERVVVKYDMEQKKVVQRLELPSNSGPEVARWLFEAPHHGLALSEDGKTICVAARESDYVALVSAPQLSLKSVIKVGSAPGWAEMAEGGELCLVPNSASNNLSFVSVTKQAEIARIPVGKGPRHVDVAQVPDAVIAAFVNSKAQ